jgi:DNA-binding beta-propeller fold protein YncE
MSIFQHTQLFRFGSLFLLSFIFVFMSYSADHFIAISHKNDVNKKITVYEPDGKQIFSYGPPGTVMENTPRFIQAIPSAKKFFVTCPNGDAETGGTVEIFDYSGNPSVIHHVLSLETGAKPFHAYVTPDDLFCVANDGDDTLSLIDPFALRVETIVGGHHHATIGFPATESGYDIYSTRFFGAGNPGGVDIIDGNTHEIRFTNDVILPLPHSVVYSPVTKKVYIACAGGIEVFGTVGEEKDVHLNTIPTTEGRMTPSLKLSPDGRYIVGNCHWDGESGSYFYSINLETEEMKSVSSVSCKGYAYSPDGKWIVAGDFNKPPEQEIQIVHIINCDPASPNYMSIVKEIPLSSPSQIGFYAHDFSPDSTTAYLGLTQSDMILKVDVTTLTVSQFSCEAAPFILSVIPLHVTTDVGAWNLY